MQSNHDALNDVLLVSEAAVAFGYSVRHLRRLAECGYISARLAADGKYLVYAPSVRAYLLGVRPAGCRPVGRPSKKHSSLTERGSQNQE